MLEFIKRKEMKSLSYNNINTHFKPYKNVSKKGLFIELITTVSKHHKGIKALENFDTWVNTFIIHYLLHSVSQKYQQTKLTVLKTLSW